jgi:hypothetical protein
VTNGRRRPGQGQGPLAVLLAGRPTVDRDEGQILFLRADKADAFCLSRYIVVSILLRRRVGITGINRDVVIKPGQN